MPPTFARWRWLTAGSVGVRQHARLRLSLKITPGIEKPWRSGWQVLSFVSVFRPAAVPGSAAERTAGLIALAELRAGNRQTRCSLADFFQHLRWRKAILAFARALRVRWAQVAFFSPELITTAFKNRPLQIEEILKPAEICAALKSPPSSAVIHLKAKLSPEMVRLVEDCGSEKEIPAATVQALVTDLNRLIQEDDLHDETAFQSVELKKRTRNLIQRVQKNGERQNIISLNRQLVEHLFPSAIRELQRTIDRTISRGTLLQDVGALLGMFAFTFAATYFNRRTAFLAAFVLCLCSVSYVFYAKTRPTRSDAAAVGLQTYLFLSPRFIFLKYSLPSGWPGDGFCYNTVRYPAAPFTSLLVSTLTRSASVAMIMSSIYLVGIVALIWAPETKGQPLPED